MTGNPIPSMQVSEALSSLTKTYTHLTHSHGAILASLITKSQIYEKMFEDQKVKLGGITETVSRNRLALKFGMGWAEALEVTSIYDVLDFVGRSMIHDPRPL